MSTSWTAPQTGLDVNVKFGGASLFEFTPELAVFDALDVRIVHGWRVDAANDAATAEALGDLGYNEVIEKVVNYRSRDDRETDAAGARLSTFLDTTASQLTYADRVER